MNSPGISCVDHEGKLKWLRFFAHKPKLEGKFEHDIFGITYPFYLNDSDRFYKIADKICSLIQWEIDKGFEVKVGLEGYSYGSTGSRLFQIAENCGIFKLLCFQRGYDVDIVAPSAVKKLATGKGNANKEMVFGAFTEQYGIKLSEVLGLKGDKLQSPLSDLSDATFMAEWRRRKEYGLL